MNKTNKSLDLENNATGPVKTETGITPTVTTSYSNLTILDIIRTIAGKKSDAVVEWINSIPTDIEKSVIAGTYLTGASLAHKLIQNEKSNEVEVIDIYPHLNKLLSVSWDPQSYPVETGNNKKSKIHFSSDLSHLKNGNMVIDTTGLGGIEIEQVKELDSCKVFLAEDPTSDGSDEVIQSKNFTSQRLEASRAPYKARIFTSGLKSKTSGTMTLTLDVLRKSLEEVLKEEGVLYAVASLDFYEGILFKEKDAEKFLQTVNRPAMVVSSLKSVNLDDVLTRYMEKVNVNIIEH